MGSTTTNATDLAASSALIACRSQQGTLKTIVAGVSDRARDEGIPRCKIPTGFFKLPSTFITTGAAIVWPKFSEALDCDACLAFIIGKAGQRIPVEKAWEHIGGITLLLDITARDINRREGLTRNNLLGKNFPSSTSIGPRAVQPTPENLRSWVVELSVDGVQQQQFRLSECLFSIEQMIARWSIIGLNPGDVLAIGASMTPRGDQLTPPAPLKIGARVLCATPAIGELSHEVVRAGATHP